MTKIIGIAILVGLFATPTLAEEWIIEHPDGTITRIYKEEDWMPSGPFNFEYQNDIWRARQNPVSDDVKRELIIQELLRRLKD